MQKRSKKPKRVQTKPDAFVRRVVGELETLKDDCELILDASVEKPTYVVRKVKLGKDEKNTVKAHHEPW